MAYQGLEGLPWRLLRFWAPIVLFGSKRRREKHRQPWLASGESGHSVWASRPGRAAHPRNGDGLPRGCRAHPARPRGHFRSGTLVLPVLFRMEDSGLEMSYQESVAKKGSAKGFFWSMLIKTLHP